MNTEKRRCSFLDANQFNKFCIYIAVCSKRKLNNTAINHVLLNIHFLSNLFEDN